MQIHTMMSAGGASKASPTNKEYKSYLETTLGRKVITVDLDNQTNITREYLQPAKPSSGKSLA